VLRHVNAPGVRLAVEERGEGEPVLLLHGGLADRDQVTEMASCLTASYRLVASPPVETRHGRVGYVA
jgi:pimeloyl-ACP methyl ester carboxylesterase